MHQNGTLAIWGSAVCNLYFSFPPSSKLALGSMKRHWLELGLAFLHPRPRLRTTAKGVCSHFVPCEGAFGTYLPESSEGASYWTQNHRDLRGCWQQDKPSCHQSEIPVVLGQFPKTSQAEKKKKKKKNETRMFLNNLGRILCPGIWYKEQSKRPVRWLSR